VKEFIFNAFVDLEPVQTPEDGCDNRRFRSFARQFWICCRRFIWDL